LSRRETVAFFMVTVELYGEERLRNLNARIGGGLKWLAVTARGADLDASDEVVPHFGSPTGALIRLVVTRYHDGHPRMI
jgi:hypothetical protein